MPSAVFEAAGPASEQPQTPVLDHAATGIGTNDDNRCKLITIAFCTSRSNDISLFRCLGALFEDTEDHNSKLKQKAVVCVSNHYGNFYSTASREHAHRDTKENYLQVKVQGQHLVHGGSGETVAVYHV
jgi:hypothetical protein